MSQKTLQRRIFREVIEWSATIAGSIAIALLLRSYAFASTEVIQNSMEDTLYQGQRLVELKMAYNFSEPKRGDIIIVDTKEGKQGFIQTVIKNAREFYENFQPTLEERYLVKRVIGVPGDRIDIQEGILYLNGKLMDEAYVKGKTFPNGMELPAEVPKNAVFVMGDNREVSLDSRALGFIDYKNIDGKAVFRVWPFDKAGKIK